VTDAGVGGVPGVTDAGVGRVREAAPASAVRPGATFAVDRISRTTAHARVERVLLSSVALATVCLTALLYPGFGGIQGQFPQLHPWYAWALLGVVSGMPVLLGVLVWLLPRPVVRALSGTTALVFLAAMLMFPVGLVGTHLTHDQPPWFQGIHAVHALLAAVVWQNRGVWLVGLLHGPIIGLVQFQVRPDSLRISLLDALGSTSFALILMGVTVALMAAADRQDRAMAQASALTTREAAVRTREREEARIDAMVHDDIMSVLVAASRPTPPEGLREKAQEALEAIASLEAPTASLTSYGPVEFANTLAQHAQAIAPQVSVGIGVNDAAPIPAEVVSATTEALEEALRNAVQHAGGPGRDVQYRMDVDVDGAGIMVRIADDGRGFVPRTVTARRLGIRLSIIDRMALLDGGTATVHSRPGRGTVVTLRWERAA